MPDTALTLKMAVESGEEIPCEKADEMLRRSELVGRLLQKPFRTDKFTGLRALEFCLIELSEIPYTYTLEPVQRLLRLLDEHTYLGDGYSLTGERDGLLACHNAITTTIFIRCGYDKDKIDAGIRWILDYQNISKGQTCRWAGRDLYEKFGGCMKNTPCYHGMVKSMVALTAYKQAYGATEEIEKKLGDGLESILNRRVYQKLSCDDPIEPSLTKLFYPYPYKTNIIEILTLLKENHLLNDERCGPALDLLAGKKREDGYWEAETSFMKGSWVEFDTVKKPGEWITYAVKKLF